MWILGISAFYHDSAAALVRNGNVVAAAQEERFSRLKNDASFPHRAIQACLVRAGISMDDIEAVVFYDKPFLKFERILETHLDFAPWGFKTFIRAMPIWLKEKLFLKSLLVREMKRVAPQKDWRARILFSEHHLSHAASAFYPSPFQNAAILTMDGVGEWATTSLAIGRGTEIEILKEIHFPHSLGFLYSAFTNYLGFKVNSGEYKVMGLAPHGKPRYVDVILQNLIDVKSDGSFRLNLEYFNFCTGDTMINRKFVSLFREPQRLGESQISQFHMDIAASIQNVLEDVVLKLGRSIAKDTGQKNLCLAGGVALNCVANGKLLADGCFENIWIQPAAGDAGGALGAALVGAHLCFGLEREVASVRDGMQGGFLGPKYSSAEISSDLIRLGARFEQLSDLELVKVCAEALSQGKALGWFHGAMEFGPRSLGARSILADPRSPTMQSVLNLKIKNRESFRPFAPAVLEEDLHDWFELSCASPYMLFVGSVAKVRQGELPAVTHVDQSARVQTVAKASDPLFHSLLTEFKRITGVPVLVNTSFNVRGEPIVCTPEDAFRCFMATDLDMLSIGQYVLRKENQTKGSISAFKTDFALD